MTPQTPGATVPHDATEIPAESPIEIPVESGVDATLHTKQTTIPWERMRNRPLTMREKGLIRWFYSGLYHEQMDYTSADLLHKTIAQFRYRITEAVFGELGKTLDAGCAAGVELEEFREQGVDCWGFDLTPDLHDIVRPGLKPYVRIGGLDTIPYSAADGFETLISFDVFEHVPIDALMEFPAELLRLGIRKMSVIISADPSPGHITIQDTAFYVDLLAQAGFRLMTEFTEALDQVPVPCAWAPNKDGVLSAPYRMTGRPRNGWNQVPGHLFFVRE